ncbi:polysaccharide export protein [Thaumasiovibrio subtropicus]|uniref:polysaccharide export protein n=1 Tax=Thaumasiovibrio subtropicus TaxID=1891207 RepID=UPI000B35BEE4|nr:polysaccharide export protein [Thaumasiovibrio subtropicus]
MAFQKKLIAIAVSSLVLAGCTMPGQHLSLTDKQVVSSDVVEQDISSLVSVYPLTPSLLNDIRVVEPYARTNPALDVEVAQFEYIVGPSDILNITVWDHPELTIPAGSYRSAADSGNWVNADGTIFYPYIGNVHVAGKTVLQIRKEITRRLRTYVESPQVDVKLAAFRSQKVYITGEVASPGVQPVTDIPLTLLDAVNKAGGLAADADWRNISFTRNGVEEVISLYALMQRGDLSQNRLLRHGDIIHIPRNDSQKVFVMGEVNDPQTLKIDRAGMSLTEALSGVGGIKQLAADATGVFVIRGNENGEQQIASIYQLDITDPSSMVLGTEFNMQPYDIVYVTAAPIERWNRVIRQLLPTISGFNELTEGALRVRNWP